MSHFILEPSTIYLNEKWEIIAVSKDIADLVLYDEKEIIGTHVTSFISKSTFEKYKRSQIDYDSLDNYFFAEFYTKEKHSIHVYASFSKEIIDNQNITKITIQKVDEIHHSLQIATKLLKYELLVREITELAVTSTNINDFLDRTLELFGKSLEVDHTFLYKHNSSLGKFVLTNSWFSKKSKLKNTVENFSFKENVDVRKELEQGMTHYSSDTSLIDNKYVRQTFEEIGIKAFINEPVFIAGNFHGFIGYNMTLTNRENMSDDITLVKSISRIIAQTIERIDALEKLRQREFFTRIQINNIDIGMAIFDNKSSKLLECNNSLESIIGYTKEEFNTLRWTSLSPQEYVDKELQLNEQLENREIESYSIEKPWRKSDGTEIFLKVRKSIYWSNDEKLYEILSYEDITERIKAFKKIEYLSFHDNLTGLYRRVYIEKIIDELEKSNTIPTSILIGDVNGLKLTNDIFGHNEGDKLLKIMADILSGVIKDKGTLCRWAGDEFVAVFPNMGYADIKEIRNQIVHQCRLYQTMHPEALTKPNISIGFASKQTKDDTLYDVFSRAEQMMYRRKIKDSSANDEFSIQSLEQTLVEKSKETKGHIERLAKVAHEFGHFLDLPLDEIKKLEIVARAHDIGKISVRNEVLNKPSALTPQEWIEIKRHPEIGYRIARTNPDLIQVSDIILSHHERVDGKGYPRGLKGEEIPYLAKILFILDAYDAMKYDRVYRRAMEYQEIERELLDNAGTQFDKNLVDQFIEFINKH